MGSSPASIPRGGGTTRARGTPPGCPSRRAPAWAPLPRARLGPMLAFSLTGGAICAFFTRRWGTWPGALSAGAWVLQPQLFGHGHYATYDALLSCLWVSSVLAF